MGHSLKDMNSSRGIVVTGASAGIGRAIVREFGREKGRIALISLRTELLHDRSNIRVCQVNLPAMNTPQFSWVKSRLPNNPQPVPPIYEPEIVARAVRHVSLHPRRTLDIAYSTIEAILAEKIAPSIADLYLAKTGYQSQQTSEPVSPERKDNLWEPLPGDHGARGSLSSQSKNFSPVLWMDLNRLPLLLLGAATIGVGTWITLRTRSKYRRDVNNSDHVTANSSNRISPGEKSQSDFPELA